MKCARGKQAQTVHKTAREIQTDIETNKPADTKANRPTKRKIKTQTYKHTHKDLKGIKCNRIFFCRNVDLRLYLCIPFIYSFEIESTNI